MCTPGPSRPVKRKHDAWLLSADARDEALHALSRSFSAPSYDEEQTAERVRVSAIAHEMSGKWLMKEREMAEEAMAADITSSKKTRKASKKGKERARDEDQVDAPPPSVAALPTQPTTGLAERRRARYRALASQCVDRERRTRRTNDGLENSLSQRTGANIPLRNQWIRGRGRTRMQATGNEEEEVPEAQDDRDDSNIEDEDDEAINGDNSSDQGNTGDQSNEDENESKDMKNNKKSLINPKTGYARRGRTQERWGFSTKGALHAARKRAKSKQTVDPMQILRTEARAVGASHARVDNSFSAPALEIAARATAIQAARLTLIALTTAEQEQRVLWWNGTRSIKMQDIIEIARMNYLNQENDFTPNHPSRRTDEREADISRYLAERWATTGAEPSSADEAADEVEDAQLDRLYEKALFGKLVVADTMVLGR